MLTKIVFLLILFTSMLVYDVPKWKCPRDRLAYIVLMLPMVYIGFLYVTDKPWPNFDELINFIFAEPAKCLVESVKPPP